MKNIQILRSPYFWVANISFWFAVLSVFVHIQYVAALGTESELSWLRTWVLSSPWFLNWIFVTALIFGSIHKSTAGFISLPKLLASQLIWMPMLLVTYWSASVLMGSLLRGDASNFFQTLFTVVPKSAHLDLAIYSGVLAFAVGIRFYHIAMQESIALKLMQNKLIQEQLKTLRSQLNPHFLFNTLNTIASLVRLKREKDAISALSELSTMLRKILENKGEQDIRVKDEMDFINSYLSIQKMRFAEKLDANISVQDDCLELCIPNMLLQPLVENAVQHGSQLESDQNPLNLSVSRSEHELTFVLTNRVAKDDSHEGFGIGISTTKERLERLYKTFKLELTLLDDGLFQTTLAIPIGASDA